MNKNLLVFFGEIRTFETVIKHFKNLDKCDVLIISWDQREDWADDGLSFTNSPITEDDFKKHVSSCNVILSNYQDKFEMMSNFGNINNMIHHWKIAVNFIENKEYEKILLHRTDVISNYDNIFEHELEKDTLYVDYGQVWVGDYAFAGDSNIIKKYINSLEAVEIVDSFASMHEVYLHAIETNNLKYKSFDEIFSTSDRKMCLIKSKKSVELLNQFYEKNINIFNDNYIDELQNCEMGES